jgi:hypothetical protein
MLHHRLVEELTTAHFHNALHAEANTKYRMRRHELREQFHHDPRLIRQTRSRR